MKLKTISVALLSWLAVPAWAADRADLDGTQILGSRELRRVLYIVRGNGRCRPSWSVGPRPACWTRCFRR